MNLPKLDNPILHSRPRAEVDWKCPRDRYYSYEFDGVGLESDSESLDMFLGTTVHDGTAVIAIQHKDTSKPISPMADRPPVDIDLIASTAYSQMFEALKNGVPGKESDVDTYAREQSTLVEGLMRGFYKHQWPLLLARFPKILAIEADVTFRHNAEGEADLDGQFIFMAKPDLVLEGPEGAVYVEYKTTRSKKVEWINSWDKSVQVHATMAAIKQTLGIDCVGVIVQGLYKGYESYGKISSPFAYAYHRWGNPPFTQTETVYEYKAGYKRYPVWELDGGCKKWVDGMPSEVLMEQFPQTPIIFPDQDMIRAFFAQRAMRELDIRLAREMILKAREAGDNKTVQSILTVTFPQRFKECKPAHGFECPRQHLCWGDGASDPLKHGCSHRTPHHSAEKEQAAANVAKP